MRRQQPIWPLNAPGMAPLGAAYVEAARLAGDEEAREEGKGKQRHVVATKTLEKLVRASLYGQGKLTLALPVSGGRRSSVNVVGGHLWGRDPEGPSYGPEPADVMVVGKMLGREEELKKRCFYGPSGSLMAQTLRKLGVDDFGSWYLTNALKTPHPDKNQGWREGWVKEFAHIFDQELRLVQPKFILCLGADALKLVTRDRKMTFGRADGQAIELTYSLNQVAGEEPQQRTALVVVARHPAEALKSPEMLPRFEMAVGRFVQLTRGVRWDKPEEDLDHQVIRNEADLIAALERMREVNEDRIVAADAEWQGDHPQNAGSYLRCVQLSWAYKQAICIALRDCEGKDAFDPSPTRAIEILGEYLQDRRMVGHMFNADLEWLVHAGLDLRPQFVAPERWEDCREQGGWDTALMAHAVDETSDFTLNGLMLRYTDCPRYDMVLQEWIKSKPEHSHGTSPDELLYPYGMLDADSSRRLAMALIPRLDSDQFGNNCWKPFWIAQRAVEAVFEINNTGLLVDRERAEALMMSYLAKKEELAGQIRRWANWPDLNLESHYQVRELLFGARYNGHAPTEEGTVRRTRPANARSMHLVPVLTTGNRPKPWEEVVREGSEKDYTPSTNKNSMGILWHAGSSAACRVRPGRADESIVKGDYEREIALVKDYKAISRIITSVLKPPDANKAGEWMEDEHGEWVFSKGLLGHICDDGRIRTFINQLKETARWSSSRPALQNLSKTMEEVYFRIMGADYAHPIRSIFRADPGHVIIEADYSSAELFGMAWRAQDFRLMEDLQRGLLPKSHPDHIDIHSKIACQAYHLNCAPTKAGLESIGKEHLRTPAKAVVYGVSYGRQAKAIAVQLRTEGLQVSTDEAQVIIDTYFGLYDRLTPYFEECSVRSVGPWREGGRERDNKAAARWMANDFGRYRRFPVCDSWSTQGDIERQAMNFGIQSLVADAMNRSVDNLMIEKKKMGLVTQLVLCVHDAVVCLAPVDEVGIVINELLPRCMSELTPIHPCHLDGTPMAAGPYHLPIDTDVYVHWGEKITKSQCRELGLSESYGK